MDIKNNALIHNQELASELAKKLPVADVIQPGQEDIVTREELDLIAATEKGMLAGLRAQMDQSILQGLAGQEPSFAGVALVEPSGPDIQAAAPDPEPRRPAKYETATKSPYNFEREKKRRKMAKRSRRINRGK